MLQTITRDCYLYTSYLYNKWRCVFQAEDRTTVKDNSGPTSDKEEPRGSLYLVINQENPQALLDFNLCPTMFTLFLTQNIVTKLITKLHILKRKRFSFFKQVYKLVWLLIFFKYPRDATKGELCLRVELYTLAGYKDISN